MSIKQTNERSNSLKVTVVLKRKASSVCSRHKKAIQKKLSQTIANCSRNKIFANMTIINIKKFSIARLLFVFFILVIYSWLVIWTTKKISVYVDDKSQPQYDETQKVSRARARAFTSNKTQNRTAINDCHKDMPITRKRWFYARYDPHIDPSWTLENSELSHSVYVWWLSLQRSDGINTEKTLQKLYDIGVGTRNEKQSSKCKRCAVVGNSGNLVNSKYGKVSW